MTNPLSSPNDLRWIIITCLGWSSLLQGLAIWRTLRDEPERQASACWSLGVGVQGLGLMLFGLRAWLPELLTYLCASLCVISSPWLLVAALRGVNGQAMPWRPMLAAAVAYTAAYQWLHLSGRADARVLLHQLCSAPAYVLLFWHARQLVLGRKSRAARELSGVALVILLGLVITILRYLGTGHHTLYAESMWPVVLTVGAMSVAVTIGNLGFVGVVLDEAHRLQRLAVAAQHREIGLRMGAESLAAQLQAQLEGRKLPAA